MQFWNTVGMGTLSGMMATAGRGLTSKAQLSSLEARIGVNQWSDSGGAESPFEGMGLLMGKGASFPSSANDRLRSMLFAHLNARDTFTGELTNKLFDMKEKFFGDFHYETETGEDGRSQVALDENGKPVLTQGKEDPTQLAARQEFEDSVHKQLSERHETDKESFLKEEKDQILNFLQTHKNELNNPSVQAELQRMILLTQKKALKMQQSQEEEIWKVDLPTDEMKDYADEEARKLRQMEEEQRQVEDGSQEAKELIMYQEELSALLEKEKEKAQEKEKDEVFLKGPAAFLKPPPPPSLASVLPPYLTEALYNMGIYSLD